MGFFPYAHATHPHWEMAAALVLAQLQAQMVRDTTASPPTLALLYLTDHYAAAAEDILHHLRAELPQVSDWSGTIGIGIAANNVEYWDEPALAIMLVRLPRTQYRVFTSAEELDPAFDAHTALVHADANSGNVTALIDALAQRTSARYLFGGISSSRGQSLQFAVASSMYKGVVGAGLSGVAFGPDVALLSEITQGCTPIARVHTITQAERNVVLQLDHEPGLDVMVSDLGLMLDQPYEALQMVRATQVALLRSDDPPGPDSTVRRTGNFGDDVVVRHIVGFDPLRGGIIVSDQVRPGAELVFCRRDVQAARADLTRICAELREELESVPEPPQSYPRSTQRVAQTPVRPATERIAGALYVSCASRGGGYFGSPSAELQIIRRVLGDVPLVGFFAAGEIARNHLYGYTGVLTLFLAD